MKKIPLYKPYITNIEKALVNEALDTGWISSRGKFVDEFEKTFANYVNRKHAISVCNGTVALHLCLEALNLPKGSAVICPTLTYVSSANSIRHAGLVPIFIDCYNTSLSEYEHFKQGFDIASRNKIKVSAIMPVHLYGRICDVNLLKEFNVPIVEDCAESFGSIKGSNVSGSHDTEFACFSFFGNKTITTGEGGMVVCNDDELYKRAAVLKGVGQAPNSPQRYVHIAVGYNYRMTNVAAAIGIGQLQNASIILENKRRIAEIYEARLTDAGLKNLLLPKPTDCCCNNWLITLVTSDNCMREGLILYLETYEIETRPAFLPMHTMVNLGNFYRVQDMHNSEYISSSGINLPSYPELNDKEVNYICDKIIEFMKKY